ncbi:glycoside hydrolase family 15 protein [Chitinasiproducens palmae]|uniref:Trehalase n=1 Tax=Chitinasiproducens palmae TaxID=1770053 RepID=A0A1H2PUS4_9BURK|nr:glycoside hydrolase family 15 protein [Chitinasiproducens palmae]SDV50955.1 Glucoamylase (glucan-1,4-alpha-glucosidase), GH15 family [Chitinasiproducens palmae]
MPLNIEDYAMIGDGHSAALVGKDGSIDWLCWPRFDSSACFSALLGTPENGRWLIAPSPEAGEATVTRRYRPDTLILETRFETPEGVVDLIDFMPRRNGWPELMRLVVCRAGAVKMRMELVLRFDYGRSVPWVRQLDDKSGVRAIAGPDMVVMRTPVMLCGENMHTVSTFSLSAGESVPFVLAYGASHEPVPPGSDVNTALARVETWWRDWAGRCEIEGEWAGVVRRSLIVLKSLAYEPTGGIVAAPTTSLPEALGGTRNWDYRYCWLRDTTISLIALMRAGYYDEAAAWRDWLTRAIAGSPSQLQIMYGIGGERRLPEWEADWLKGYQGARPVRIGNGAVCQLQLDVFGETLSALYVARAGGLPNDEESWAIECKICEHLETVWRQPDEGVWEVRGGRQHFTFSKIMAWLAFDRAIHSAERFRLDGPVAHWKTLRDEIHADVCANAYDAERNTFVQAYGSKSLDASLLLIGAIGFLPAEDPRYVGTVEAVAKELTVEGLVKRYHTNETDDGLPPGEGTFLACSFWLVDSYVALGRRDEAVALFERLLSLCNDVGLLAEEYDPDHKRQVGNFPQAFSHFALVHSAMNLMGYRNIDTRALRQDDAA